MALTVSWQNCVSDGSETSAVPEGRKLIARGVSPWDEATMDREAPKGR